MLLKSERPTNDVLRNPNDIVTSNLSYEGIEKCEMILNKFFCSITDLEDDGIDLPDFDDRCSNTLTLDPNKAVGLILLVIQY